MYVHVRRTLAACALAASLALSTTACLGDDNKSNTGSAAKASSLESDTTDGDRLLCRNSYPSNNTIDFCGLRFQQQTFVVAQTGKPAKIYSELDSTNSWLNTKPSCAAEHCVRPAPAGTEVKVICIENNRFGIVAPPEHIIDQGNVHRYTTAKVGAKHVSGFEGDGAGVPVGFIDATDIANSGEVTEALRVSLENRFGEVATCDDTRIISTDRVHREGWNLKPDKAVSID